ncbi:TetR family transcriptional regulator [Conexibacter sp. SYSU D00693]|uniref:TetR family transcriptional regulator n=1 Tax=Conexibacter sp. SYSU D00693 TaxID=2812560 RepID=UPI00196A72BE|nr:TetR family transcriptional regulator [Conexibacter sp. SYSU D00693]
MAKGARTRRRILDAAAEAFAERGYAATSLADVAGAAGMQAGSLYFHFAAKDALVEEVLAEALERSLERVRAAVDATADAGPAARLDAAVRAHLDALRDLRAYAAAVLDLVAEVPPEVRRRHAERLRPYAELWAGLVAEAQRAGHLPRDPAAPLLVGLLWGALNASAHPRWPHEPQATADALLALVGLRPTDGAAAPGA